MDSKGSRFGLPARAVSMPDDVQPEFGYISPGLARVIVRDALARSLSDSLASYVTLNDGRNLLYFVFVSTVPPSARLESVWSVSTQRTPAFKRKGWPRTSAS